MPVQDTNCEGSIVRNPLPRSQLLRRHTAISEAESVRDKDSICCSLRVQKIEVDEKVSPKELAAVCASASRNCMIDSIGIGDDTPTKYKVLFRKETCQRAVSVTPETSADLSTSDRRSASDDTFATVKVHRPLDIHVGEEDRTQAVAIVLASGSCSSTDSPIRIGDGTPTKKITFPSRKNPDAKHQPKQASVKTIRAMLVTVPVTIALLQ